MALHPNCHRNSTLNLCHAVRSPLILLQLGYNPIPTFDAASLPLLASSCPRLSTLYLEHCPVAADWEYRKRVAREVPTLTQIDATTVRR